jgi:hypothetical protein
MSRHDDRRELRSRSPRVARVVSWLLAVLVSVGLVVWAWNSWRLIDPCQRVVHDAAGCQTPPLFLRSLQVVVAVPGVVAGAVSLVYLVYLATTGRTWRRWREVAITFGVLVLTWTVVFAVGAIVVRFGG